MALQEWSCDVGLARPSQVGGIMWKPRESGHSFRQGVFGWGRRLACGTGTRICGGGRGPVQSCLQWFGLATLGPGGIGKHPPPVSCFGVFSFYIRRAPRVFEPESAVPLKRGSHCSFRLAWRRTWKFHVCFEKVSIFHSLWT